MSNWEKYELQIFEKFKSFFPNCKVEHNKKVKGLFSKVSRQIDISILGKIEGYELFGVVECKYLNRKIDIQIVESFIGFLEDVEAEFGYLITHKGFSKAAQNRALTKNFHLQIIEFQNLNTIQIDVDDLINYKINSLSCLEPVFLLRQQQRGHFVDLKNTSFEKCTINFKEGFVQTEYFAFKKLLEESARAFRDFPCMKKIKIIIPQNNMIFWSELEITELEKFLNVSFELLRKDIKAWRIMLGSIRKSSVLQFEREFVNKS